VDEMTITFKKDENIEEFVKLLDLKEGNLYLVIKPEEDGFQIIGADRIPLDTDNEISTNMYVLFAGLMHMATEQQDLVMEAGNYSINEELDRKEREKLRKQGDNIVKFPGK
jgi:hypothetical protein